MNRTLCNLFYVLKPCIPRKLQLFTRRQIGFHKKKKNDHIWPIDPEAGNTPDRWDGWPDQKKFAFVITHDVDTQKGHDRCYKLMDFDEQFGFKSSFNFVPEGYEISTKLLSDIAKRGFENGVHGLKHDGKLYKSKKIFQVRASKIKKYIKKWEAKGFRSPSMHHNLDWLHELEVQYDSSTFDTDPFEPQSEGVGTIFPFWVKNLSNQKGYVELPYTLPQDFTVFILLKEKTNEIWKQKLDWIAERGGMALVNVHPDYLNFDDKSHSIEEYPAKYYENFLVYIT